MKRLVISSVRTGSVIDRVHLDASDNLVYESGRGKVTLEAPRSVKPALTDAELYALRTSWSNGYIQTAEVAE